MLTIRAQQLAILGADAERQFIERMCLHLRQQFPDETKERNDAELQQQIRNEIRTAKTFELISERDIVLYLHLGMMYGPGFIENEQNAWMLGYLEDVEVPSVSDRMQRLYQTVIQKLELESENRKVRARFEQTSPTGP